MQDAAQHPALLYVVLGVTILITIAGAVPKILGPLGEAFKARAEAARAAAADADDADIAERDRQIAYLRGVAAERLRELRARDELAALHAPWDWDRYAAAIKAGHEVTPPPPLIPDIPPPPHGHVPEP